MVNIHRLRYSSSLAIPFMMKNSNLLLMQVCLCRAVIFRKGPHFLSQCRMHGLQRKKTIDPSGSLFQWTKVKKIHKGFSHEKLGSSNIHITNCIFLKRLFFLNYSNAQTLLMFPFFVLFLHCWFSKESASLSEFKITWDALSSTVFKVKKSQWQPCWALLFPIFLRETSVLPKSMSVMFTFYFGREAEGF